MYKNYYDMQLEDKTLMMIKEQYSLRFIYIYKIRFPKKLACGPGNKQSTFFNKIC